MNIVQKSVSVHLIYSIKVREYILILIQIVGVKLLRVSPCSSCDRDYFEEICRLHYIRLHCSSENISNNSFNQTIEHLIHLKTFPYHYHTNRDATRPFTLSINTNTSAIHSCRDHLQTRHSFRSHFKRALPMVATIERKISCIDYCNGVP